MNGFHTPVLLKEVISFLNVQEGKKYIDATLGGGGHSFEILKRGGKVLGIDCDQEAIDYTTGKWKLESRRLKIGEENLTLVRGNFRDVDKIAHLNGFEAVLGIIFDLGVSSHQLESPSRGFSFQKEAPLDMRMDQDLGVRALDIINILTKGELYELFTKLGEEHRAFAISSNIIRSRRVKPIGTTGELALIVEKAYGMKKGAASAFAKALANKRVFQALRMLVNDELNNLKEALPKAVGLLEERGVLGVISFHSLEDRIVKNAFVDFQKENLGNILTKKPIMPTFEEQRRNRRSRSAKLRVFKKV